MKWSVSKRGWVGERVVGGGAVGGEIAENWMLKLQNEE